MSQPKDAPIYTPLEEWTEGWLKMEVAVLARKSLYIIMTDEEKRAAGLPVTADEMRIYIKEKLVI
jgi:hypothetical protein